MPSDDDRATKQERARCALILSGGGARGAYEVGVLSHVFDHHARSGKPPPRVDLYFGTSVGAINACYLASHLDDPTLGVRRLVELWTDVRMDEVLGFGLGQLTSLPRLLTGGGRQAVGLFDVGPMARLVEREVGWRAIVRGFRERKLLGLSVSATDVQSGKTVLFVQTARGVAPPSPPPPRTIVRHARIGPIHALASAAIPILFPQVRIGHHLYMDGGVRQNTPIAPALRMGATHVFVIGLTPQLGDAPVDGAPKPPGVATVVGKVLNAILLDHITSDFEVLDRVNKMIDHGSRAFGPGFLDALNEAARASDHLPYRRVQTEVLRPSVDIGTLAAQYLRSPPPGARPALRRLLHLVDVGAASDADLASYLLFDGGFAKQLIELGRSDAEARRHEIEAFFEDVAECGRAD